MSEENNVVANEEVVETPEVAEEVTAESVDTLDEEVSAE